MLELMLCESMLRCNIIENQAILCVYVGHKKAKMNYIVSLLPFDGHSIIIMVVNKPVEVATM